MLTREEILHIADLARIGLEENEIEKYQKDLSAVLDYFKKMAELDTDQVKPIDHITGMHNIARPDAPEDFGTFGKEAILANAPEVKEGSVKVKSVL